MTTTIDRKAAMTPFAEHPCPNENAWDAIVDGKPVHFEDYSDEQPDTCHVCNGTGYDPRFESLRCWHEGIPTLDWAACAACGYSVLGRDGKPQFGLRTDLGALVATALSCGKVVEFLVGEVGEVLASVTDAEGRNGYSEVYPSEASQVERVTDALAQAIVAAMPL